MSAATHKAIAATAPGKIGEVDLPTPEPAAGEVLVEMKFAGLSPVDAYQVDDGFFLTEDSYPHVFGFAGAGVVHKVGKGVDVLKVSAFNYGGSKTKPLQKYCIVPQTLVAKIPDALDFATAASMPDNYVTAMYTIFGLPCLNFPLPADGKFPAASAPSNADVSILVYGAGSTSGQYVVQVLKLAGYTNTIAAASKHHHELLASLGAKASIDYHDNNLAEKIVNAGGKKVEFVIDCIGSKPFIEAYVPAVAEGATVGIFIPVKDGAKVNNGKSASTRYSAGFPDWLNKAFEKAARVIPIYAFRNQADPVGRDIFMPKILPQLLEDGLLRPNPLERLDEESMPGSSVLKRMEKALTMFRNNKVSGQKLVIEIEVSF